MSEGKAINILLVEDDDMVRAACADILSGEGYSVATAANGLEAIGALKARPFDMVITDMRMPVMDGWVLYEYLKRDFPYLRRKVLFMSGFFSRDRSMPEERALQFLKKPFSVAAFLDRVRLLASNGASPDAAHP